MTANHGRCGTYLKEVLRLMAIAMPIVAGMGLAGTPQVAVAASVASISSSGYPVSAFLVPVSQAASLQTLLDQHKVIRLLPGNYATSGPASLTIKSGYKIYGLPVTVVPPLVVTPGTTGAVVSGVKTTALTFPTSSVSTHDNLFLRIDTTSGVGTGKGFWAVGATLENNLFLSNQGRFTLDDSASGYFRTNRFIRTMYRTTGGTALLTLKGNTLTRSYNNTFLMSNFLTPFGDTADLSGLTDATFVGFDVELWNYMNATPTGHGAVHVASDVGTLRMLTVGGGTDGSQYSKAVPTYEFGAKNVIVINDMIKKELGANAVPKVNLTSSSQFVAFLNGPSTSSTTTATTSSNNMNPSGASTSYRTFKPGTPLDYTGVVAQSTSYPISAYATKLTNALISTGSGRSGRAWEAPVYDAVPDPAGAAWNKNLASQPDSTAYIQGLINAATPGVAFLPAGTYYISSPLVLNNNQGLVGAGMDKTVIIAKDPSIDMIVGGDALNTRYVFISMTLSDLTLQGGANGIHHDYTGSGGFAGYFDMFLSHVTFRNMSNAGIFLNRIYGYDNNLFDHLNFVNNKYGFLQIPSPNTVITGTTPQIGYLDKTVFYANQFIGNSIGVSLQPQRADNLDVWVETLFQDNTDGAVQMNYNNNAVFANSDFINNGGSVLTATSSTHTTCVSCRFQSGVNGKTMVKGDMTIVDSTFAQAGGTATILPASNRAQNDFFNSTSSDMALGQVYSGYFVNNYLLQNLPYSLYGMEFVAGVGTTFSGTALKAAPTTQFLWGSRLAFRY